MHPGSGSGRPGMRLTAGAQAFWRLPIGDEGGHVMPADSIATVLHVLLELPALNAKR